MISGKVNRPLSADWKPDSRQFADTALWIEEPGALLVRWSPLLAVLVLLTISVAMELVKVESPRPVNTSILRVVRSDSLNVVYLVSAQEEVASASGQDALLLVTPVPGGRPVKLQGRVQSVLSLGANHRIVFHTHSDPGTKTDAVLVIRNERVSLRTVLFNKIQIHGGVR